MFPVYTAEALAAKSISELKAIARQIGALPTTDLRKRANWVDAIISHQQAVVELVVPEDHEPEIAQAKSTCKFIAEEGEIVDQINVLTDALNFAILSDSYSADCPSIRKLEEEIDHLNGELESIGNLHRKHIQSLCMDAAVDVIDIDVDIWWQGDSNGAVSIDRGQTYRCFRVLDMLSDRPVVKLIVSKKNEIDSRWATTKNNRYMRAVLQAIPAHIQQVASEIWEDGQVVGYAEEQQPPGKGDGRDGRIECGADEWVEF